MIPYVRDAQQTIPTSAVKIIGLGGAGSNMLERIALDGIEGDELLALNTDVRTLTNSLAREKIQLGVNLTKGLGCGGDPELGLQAVLEAEDEVRAAIKGRRIIFLCVGLGGGTGSGAAPMVTRIAREEGAFVVVFASTPFAFEGRRRRDQAESSLNELAVLSNALVTFDNNRMGELVLAKQGIHEAFAAADVMICESIKAVIRLVIRPGLINVGLDDLMSALRTNRSRCLFGSGIANGKDRASRALKNALSSPLLDQGALLKNASTVLVHLSGGEDLTLFEIELLMQRLQKFIPESAHVLFGAAIDPGMGDSLSITLISALPEDSLAGATRDSLSLDTREVTLLDPAQGYTEEAAPVAVKEPEPVQIAAAAPAAAPTPLPAVARVPVPTLPPVAAPQPAWQEIPKAEPPHPAYIPTLFDDATPFAEPDLQREEEVEEPEYAEQEFLDETEAMEEPPMPIAEPEPEAIEEYSEEILYQAEPEEEPLLEQESAAQEEPEPELESVFQQPLPTPLTSYVPSPKRRLLTTLWGKVKAEELLPVAAQAPVYQEPPAPVVEYQYEPESEPQAESAPNHPTADNELPKLKLGIKTNGPQSELSLDSAPRGRFEGENPNVFEGEDLDLPPFLRKRK